MNMPRTILSRNQSTLPFSSLSLELNWVKAREWRELDCEVNCMWLGGEVKGLDAVGFLIRMI